LVPDSAGNVLERAHDEEGAWVKSEVGLDVGKTAGGREDDVGDMGAETGGSEEEVEGFGRIE
jgi:hypothetical protein